MSLLDTLFGRTRVKSAGTLLPNRSSVNVSGAGATVTDDPANDEIDIVIAGGLGSVAGDITELGDGTLAVTKLREQSAGAVVVKSDKTLTTAAPGTNQVLWAQDASHDPVFTDAPVVGTSVQTPVIKVGIGTFPVDGVGVSSLIRVPRTFGQFQPILTTTNRDATSPIYLVFVGPGVLDPSVDALNIQFSDSAGATSENSDINVFGKRFINLQADVNGYVQIARPFTGPGDGSTYRQFTISYAGTFGAVRRSHFAIDHSVIGTQLGLWVAQGNVSAIGTGSHTLFNCEYNADAGGFIAHTGGGANRSAGFAGITNEAINLSGYIYPAASYLIAGLSGLTDGTSFVPVARFSVSMSDGTVRMWKYTTGIAHFDSSGQVSSSLITNADVNDVAFSKLTGKPTTLSGYGITDGVSSSRQVIAGAGLTGGGDLSADRTISVAAADGTIVVNADSIQVGTVPVTQIGSTHEKNVTGTVTAAPSSNATLLLATIPLTVAGGFPSASFHWVLDGVITAFSDDVVTNIDGYIDVSRVMAVGRVVSGTIGSVGTKAGVTGVLPINPGITEESFSSGSGDSNIGNYQIDVSGSNLLVKLHRPSGASDAGGSYTWYYDLKFRVIG